MKTVLCLFAVLISTTAAPTDVEAPADVQDQDAFWGALITAGIEILKDVVKHAIGFVADAEGMHELGLGITTALQLKRDIARVRSLPLESRQNFDNFDVNQFLQHAMGLLNELLPLFGMPSPFDNSGSTTSQGDGTNGGGLLGSLAGLGDLMTGLFQFGKRIEHIEKQRELLDKRQLSTEQVRQYNADINQLIQHGLGLWNGLKPYLSNPDIMNTLVSGLDQLLYSNSQLGKRLEELEARGERQLSNAEGEDDGPLGQVSRTIASWFQKKQLLEEKMRELRRLASRTAASA